MYTSVVRVSTMDRLLGSHVTLGPSTVICSSTPRAGFSHERWWVGFGISRGDVGRYHQLWSFLSHFLLFRHCTIIDRPEKKGSGIVEMRTKEA